MVCCVEPLSPTARRISLIRVVRGGLGDEAVTPDAVEKVRLGDDLVPSLDEHDEEVERLRLEMHDLPPPAHLARPGIDLRVPEAVHGQILPLLARPGARSDRVDLTTAGRVVPGRGMMMTWPGCGLALTGGRARATERPTCPKEPT